MVPALPEISPLLRPREDAGAQRGGDVMERLGF